MKKNENGYPCFNQPRTDSGSATRNNSGISQDMTEGNNEITEPRTQRPKEGCSRNNGVEQNGYMQGSGANRIDNCDNVPLAYVYAPIQKFCMLYTADEALKHGTLFENLYKPMGVYGNE